MDKSKRQSRLQHLRSTLPGPVEQVGITYCDGPSQANLIRLLQADPAQAPAVLEMADFLGKCTRDARCNLSVCRNCGRRMKLAEVKRNFKSLFAAIGDRPPQDQLAWITVNYELINPLDETGCRSKAESFRKSLQNAFTTHFKGYKAVGHMDVSDGLVLHAHILVWAAQLDRNHLVKTLRNIFTADRAVCLSEWYRLEDHNKRNQERIRRGSVSLEDCNLTEVISYSTKVLPEVEMTPDRRLIHREDISRIAGMRLLGLLMIRGNGLRGGMIKIGLRKPKWKFVRDLMVHRETGEYKSIPFVTELMKAKRKGPDDGFVAEKIRRRLWQKVESGGYVLLTAGGNEYVDPQTGEIITIPVERSPASSLRPHLARVGRKSCTAEWAGCLPRCSALRADRKATGRDPALDRRLRAPPRCTTNHESKTGTDSSCRRMTNGERVKARSNSHSK